MQFSEWNAPLARGPPGDTMPVGASSRRATFAAGLPDTTHSFFG